MIDYLIQNLKTGGVKMSDKIEQFEDVCQFYLDQENFEIEC